MYFGGSVVLIRLALFSFEMMVKTFAHCGPTHRAFGRPSKATLVSRPKIIDV